jgi:hypothetical protein
MIGGLSFESSINIVTCAVEFREGFPSSNATMLKLYPWGVDSLSKVLVLNIDPSATDKGSTPVTGTAVISVNLIDINDNAPQFTKSVYVILSFGLSGRFQLSIFDIYTVDTTLIKIKIITFKKQEQHFVISLREDIMTHKVIYPPLHPLGHCAWKCLYQTGIV